MVNGLEITTEQGGRVVRLAGTIDEGSDLSPLMRLKGAVELHLGEVRRINSHGVRNWIDVMRKLPADADVELHECSPAVVDQANMVAGFLGKTKVVSFYAQLCCEDDLVEEEQLFTVAAVRAAGNKLPPVPCPRCKKTMTLDDIEGEVLLFLGEE
jgi:hypothetical protein